MLIFNAVASSSNINHTVGRIELGSVARQSLRPTECSKMRRFDTFYHNTSLFEQAEACVLGFYSSTLLNAATWHSITKEACQRSNEESHV